MRTWLVSFLLLVVSTPIFAVSDYAREKNWDKEITPSIIVGDPIYLTQKNQHTFLGIYTVATNAKMGVVVVHGMGIHPDWGMISTLRQRLPEYGYTTLSIQMPILEAEAKPGVYAKTFPEAVERLQLAVKYLQDKGYKKIALVSHSMGSRMSHGYMIHNPAGVNAWAALGAGTGPGAALTYAGINAPVLDLYGANDEPLILTGAAKRKASLQGKAGSKQVVVPDADHFFADHEDQMVMAVKYFLDDLR